jgi:hypothetical protein
MGAEGLASDLAGKLVAMVASAEESSMAASTLNQVHGHNQSALLQDIISQSPLNRVYLLHC